ncbi:hypothetical protein BC938DRAFT_480150 [Jimgerdemannia flammicorona]|uniref:Proliferating cell nuclear antigen PCNA N-terminal domain-containing protein n=1 Tax=Jimgerdemannia flammicorona TaxID=994334 RepID=A0A433QJ94_9FUNG|nr:hypothetical protein BC938DRAFT_480150 [Jimgerdemannia flammicorona]
MIDAYLHQAKPLKDIIKATKKLMPQCKFECDDTGITLKATYDSDIASAAILPGSNRMHVKVSCLGVDLNNLSALLKWTDDDDTLTINLIDYDS